jgi:hypothetical protein
MTCLIIAVPTLAQANPQSRRPLVVTTNPIQMTSSSLNAPVARGPPPPTTTTTQQRIPGFRLLFSVVLMAASNPPTGTSTWAYPALTTTSSTTSIPYSHPHDSTSRPSSTNPYNNPSVQAFDRAAPANPWQSTNLDPSDFPALGSSSAISSHGSVPPGQSYASTAGQRQFARQDEPYSSSTPFNSEEFPALGRAGIPQHLSGQQNGVYDSRQMETSLGAQAQLDHRASMLETLQQGQRVTSRTGGQQSGRGSVDDLTLAPVGRDNRVMQGFPGEEQKVTPISVVVKFSYWIRRYRLQRPYHLTI